MNKAIMDGMLQAIIIFINGIPVHCRRYIKTRNDG